VSLTKELFPKSFEDKFLQLVELLFGEARFLGGYRVPEPSLKEYADVDRFADIVWPIAPARFIRSCMVRD